MIAGQQMIIDTAEPMADGLRPTANGQRHFRLQISRSGKP